VQALQDPAETHPFGVEEPGAVAGLQNKGFHTRIIALKTDENDTGVLRFRDDRDPRDTTATRRPVCPGRVRREWFQQHNQCFGVGHGAVATGSGGPRRVLTDDGVTGGGDPRQGPR
jgi:hypothetical protein